jgi:putative transposase
LVRSVEDKRALIEPDHPHLSVRRQCELLGLHRSNLYYTPVRAAGAETALNLELMRRLDEQYTQTPFYGVRRMTAWLGGQGYEVNPKRVRRLLRRMGLWALYPGPRTSTAAPGHPIYPYLLRGVAITARNQVWSSDITYIRLRRGFCYLVAIIDWFSRYVLAWEVATSLDGQFCLTVLERALAAANNSGLPQIFNTDQGAQFTSQAFTGRLQAHDIRISMDGRGRALDNIFVERLWRSVKYEEVYLHDYQTLDEAAGGLGRYFAFYNHQRLHQALAYQTPAAVYWLDGANAARSQRAPQPEDSIRFFD